MASWIDVLKSPYAAFTEEKEKAAWTKILFNILVPGIIAAVLISLLAVVASMIWPAVGFMLAMLLGAINLSALDWIVLAVKIVFFWVLWFFFINLVLFVASKVLGGTGDFKSQSYLYSKQYVAFFISFVILYAALAVLSVLFWLFATLHLPNLLFLLPFAGLILFFFAYLDLIQYCVYVLYALLKVEHGFSRGRAIAVLILFLIFLGVIAWLLSKLIPQLSVLGLG